MPKERPPFDRSLYEELKAQGLSQRRIAQEMRMPEATLRDNLKVLAHHHGKGTPIVSQGIPAQENPRVHQNPPQVSSEGIPEEYHSKPPLYVHPGIPDDSEESPVGAEEIAGAHEGIPALPRVGIHEEDQGPPEAGLSPELVEELTAVWPEIHIMLMWWRDRQRLVQDAATPERQLERQTYHIEKRFIEAVRHEADLTGESYAAVVNRAFAQYFTAKST
jgi:hypothetical protein